MRMRQEHRRGPHGHGRHRARRGAVAASVLTLLAERPMHGYELITALDERSEGRWRPSPGAIYPALSKLEERGLLSSEEVDGKRRYEITEQGRERLAEQQDVDDTAPWERGPSRGSDLRHSISELSGPAKQIGRFGTAEQATEAVAAVKEATAKLYQILADGAAEQSDT